MLRGIVRTFGVSEGLDTGLVVRASSLGDEGTLSVTLEVGDGYNGCIDGELLIVDAEAVTVSVGVREEARLENGVSRSFDPGYQVRRREGDLSKKVKICCKHI